MCVCVCVCVCVHVCVCIRQVTVAGVPQVGDRVTVEVEEEVVRSLQQGHGGWSEGMAEVCHARWPALQ